MLIHKNKNDLIFKLCQLILAAGLLLTATSPKADIKFLQAQNEASEKLLIQIKDDLKEITSPHKITIGVGDSDLQSNDSILVLTSASPFVEKPFQTPTYLISNIPPPNVIANYLSSHFKTIRVGMLRSSGALQDEYINSLKAQLAKSDITIIDVEVKNSETIAGLRDLTNDRIDVMLIIRNADIYKNENLRTVMEFLFRKRIPTITTIKGLLQAGAISAITIDDEELLSKTNSLINLLANQTSNPSLTYPYSDVKKIIIYAEKARVDVNQEAAKFYGLSNLGETK